MCCFAEPTSPQNFRSLIDLARCRIEDGTASLTTALSTMLDATGGGGQPDGLVCDVLFRELCSARELLHSYDDDYVKLAAKFKEKASAALRPVQSSEYLEALSAFTDGRIPSTAANWTLQVRRFFIGPLNA